MKEDTENFEETIKTKPKAYVLFYASWCPHSQRFLPIFKAYAKTNPEQCLAVMVDFKAELCDKYSINYYPTVLLFKEGNVEKRLDATPGLGLTEEQLTELTSKS
jgi:thiol-disulfide isomerase/thioredoxin